MLCALQARGEGGISRRKKPRWWEALEEQWVPMGGIPLVAFSEETAMLMFSRGHQTEAKRGVRKLSSWVLDISLAYKVALHLLKRATGAACLLTAIYTPLLTRVRLSF